MVSLKNEVKNGEVDFKFFKQRQNTQGYFSLISVMEGYETDYLVCDHIAWTGQTGSGPASMALGKAGPA